jgi:hypothetical protein
VLKFKAWPSLSQKAQIEKFALVLWSSSYTFRFLMYYWLAVSQRFNFDIPRSCHSYSAMEHIIAITVRCYAPRKLILKTNFLVICEVLLAVTMRNADVWNMTPCSILQVYQRFIGNYSLHFPFFYTDDWGNTVLRNSGKYIYQTMRCYFSEYRILYINFPLPPKEI